MAVYRHKLIGELREFYGPLLRQQANFASVHHHLEALANRMWEGVQDKNVAIYSEIANYHKEHLGRNIEVLKRLDLDLEACRKTIAHEYGFRRWTEVTHQSQPYDLIFEHTIDAMLEGNTRDFRQNLIQHPFLTDRKSAYGHQATLLHYAVANGVEMWRQQVPLNLAESVEFLLERGINTQAKMKVYGGEYRAAELLMSSAHPREAGLTGELHRLLGNGD